MLTYTHMCLCYKCRSIKTWQNSDLKSLKILHILTFWITNGQITFTNEWLFCVNAFVDYFLITSKTKNKSKKHYAKTTMCHFVTLFKILHIRDLLIIWTAPYTYTIQYTHVRVHILKFFGFSSSFCTTMKVSNF